MVEVPSTVQEDGPVYRPGRQTPEGPTVNAYLTGIITGTIIGTVLGVAYYLWETR